MSESESDYDPSASVEPVSEPVPETMSESVPESVSEPLSAESVSVEPEIQLSNDQDSDDSEYNPEDSSLPESKETLPETSLESSESKSSLPDKPLVKADSKEPESPDSKDGEDDDYDPEALLSDSNPTALTESAPQQSHSEPEAVTASEKPLSKSEQVQQFNSIITHFMSTPYLNDPTFQSLTPDQKSLVVLADYNKAKGSSIKTEINFQATTSFNKQFLKKNETAFPLVPVNPFCKRPDITSPKSYDFQQSFNEFAAEEAKWMRTGRMETLPSGSRLFIGNLPVNSITKEDCYRLFRPYGEIVQISIKPGYGFVQFATAEGCNDALEGETNVPLHGKMLQLEVSKTQIRQAQEYQERQRRLGSSSTGDDEDRRDSRRGRSRSPSPSRDQYKRRSPMNNRASLDNGSNGIECQIFQMPDSSPMFVRRLMKVLRREGISYKIDQNVDDVESAGNDAAYAGVMAVVVLKADDLNVKTFEKTSDGGIKFDEYANISVEEADSILSAAKAKRGGSSSHSHSNPNSNSYSSGFEQKDYYRNNNRGNYQNNRQPRNDQRVGDRNRGRGNNMRPRNNYDQPQQGYQSGSSQYGYQGYQQPAPQAPVAMPQGLPQGLPQNLPQMDPSAVYAQLQNYDPATIQQVLSLLGQQQQQGQQAPPPMQQQPVPQYGGYQQQQQQQLPPPQQYGGYQQPMPQQQPPPQQYYQQQPPPTQQQQPQQPLQQYYQQPVSHLPAPQLPAPHAPAPASQSPPAPLQTTSSGSSLLEALARLKKSS